MVKLVARATKLAVILDFKLFILGKLSERVEGVHSMCLLEAAYSDSTEEYKSAECMGWRKLWLLTGGLCMGLVQASIIARS